MSQRIHRPLTFLVAICIALPVCVFLLTLGWIAFNFVCPTCISLQPHATIPSLPRQTPAPISLLGYTPIDPANARALEELDHIDLGTRSPVAALDINPANGAVVAVTRSGSVARFPLATPGQILTNDVGPVSLRATTANTKAGILVTAADRPRQMPAKSPATPPDTVSVWDYHVWNIQSGRAITTMYDHAGPAYSLALSQGAKWLATAPAGLLSMHDVNTGISTYQGGFGSYTKVNRVEALAFDAAGEYLATANANSAVAIFHLNATGELDFSNGDYLESGTGPNGLDRDQELKPLALAFDQARKQLVLLRDNEVIVYDLGTWRQTFRSTVSLTTSPAGSVAFDPTGQLLAIGTQEGWQIWDLAQGRKLIEHTGILEHGTYAVAFSADGRAFVWGDLSGYVHIWGVPS